VNFFLFFLFLSILVCCKNSNTENVIEIEVNNKDTSTTVPVDISDLFIQYLQQVHKIENPPQNEIYIVIDLFVCPPCLKEYIPAVEKIFNNNRRKSFPSLIVVGNTEKPPDWFSELAKNHKNVYYDSNGFYNRINVIPNESGIVVVKDGKIIERTIIKMDNYKTLFKLF